MIEYQGSKNRIFIDGPVARIDLGKGRIGLVDTEDVPRIAHIRWGASSRYSGAQYVTGYCPDRKRACGLHQYIMGTIGAGVKTVVDHIHGDTLDNRKGEIRVTDRPANRHNLQSILARGKPVEGYIGVTAYQQSGETKYAATLAFNSKNGTFKPFDTAEEAAEFRDDVYSKVYGADFVRLNFPQRRSA